jgi:eukaryotic translation initiation factor 2C
VRDGPPQRIPFSSAGDPGLVDLIQGFKQKLLRAGMTVPADPKVFFTEGLPGPNHDPDRKRSLALIKQAFTQNLNPKAKPSFVLVLLCMEDDHIYPGVKHLGDVSDLASRWGPAY